MAVESREVCVSCNFIYSVYPVHLQVGACVGIYWPHHFSATGSILRLPIFSLTSRHAHLSLSPYSACFLQGHGRQPLQAGMLFLWMWIWNSRYFDPCLVLWLLLGLLYQPLMKYMYGALLEVCRLHPGSYSSHLWCKTFQAALDYFWKSCLFAVVFIFSHDTKY